jgi:ectoine hydroxylase-related dioxygenase (phytanoyl-CoA dioxygenase family)
MQNKNYQPFLESLDELGFATFKVFDDVELQALKTLYGKHFAQKEITELYASHNSNPVEKSLSINESIRQIVSNKLQEVFPDYNYFIGHFMVKGAHTAKEFALHQDWNIVDEMKFKSWQIWIPLQLTYPANGGIFIVPGSHRFFNNYRSGSYGIPVVNFEEKLQPLVTDVIVPTGNVLVYQNGLFHASHPNVTDTDRIAVIVNFVQKNAPTYYFQHNETNTTDLYSITGETLIRHLPQLEKGIVHESFTKVETIQVSPVKNSSINADDLAAAYRKKFGERNAAQLKQLHITTSKELEEQLNETGYAVIDLLNEQEVEAFKTEYKLHFGHIDRTPGRFTTLQDAGNDLKKRMHRFIVKNVDAPLRKYFTDFIIPVSQFYTKKAFTSGDIDIHADSTLLLNHQLEPHYAIWVALVDVDENNGTLSVIPNSHKIQRAIFSASLGGYHNEHTEWLRQFEMPIKLKAGQAIIFDNNLLHNSTANKSCFDRLVFTFRITHYASQYYSYLCLNPAQNSSVDVSEEAHSYYMDDNWDGNSREITGKYIGAIQQGVTHATKDELEKILNLSYS